MTKTAPYQAYCDKRRLAYQFRQLQETTPLSDGCAECDGKTYINFGGNDYLGLSQHPKLIARAQDYAKHYGVGATASRLVTGNLPIYRAIEQKLAQGKGCETALVMNSGYQANITVLPALADTKIIGKSVTILADRLCHNSLLQGALLSGAQLIRFDHNDYDHLKKLLQQEREKDAHIIIVTESVFGMDGDRADLATLIALKEKYDAMLYVDEAHATGLFGANGFGFAADHNGAIDIVMGTFGKALGSFGAYIACSTMLHDFLVQRCGGFIYSTALPPTVLGAIEAALEIIPTMQSERDYLQTQAERLRQHLQQQGWQCGTSTTQIIPIILGDEKAATTLAEQLKKSGVLAPAIRPPTVPRGTSRLRISLSAAHKAADIDHLIEVMASQASRFATPQTQSLAS